MAELQRVRGATKNLFRIFLKNSSTGLGLTGLTNASSSLQISAIRELSSTVTTYTSAGSTIQTISTLGTFVQPTAGNIRFQQVDATNFPGLYEIQPLDTLFSTSDGSRFIDFVVFGPTNCTPTTYRFELESVNFQDGIAGGMTALPQAAASASGGIPTIGTSTGQIALSSGDVTIGGYATGEDPATLVLGAAASSWASGGSIGALINLIQQIDSFGVIVVNPVNQAGQITLIAGLAYLAANSNAVTFSSYNWINLAGLTITMFNTATNTVIATGTVVTSGGPSVNQEVSFDFASSATTSLETNSPYSYVIRAATTGSNYYPLASGILYVNNFVV